MMDRPGRWGAGPFVRLAIVVVVVLGAVACSGGGAAVRSPTSRTRSSPPPVGPSEPAPLTSEQAARGWILHWARAFVTLGQELVSFRQAERSGDLARMARLAIPIQGAAQQVAAGIRLAPEPPSFIAPRTRHAERLLAGVEGAVREVRAACHPPSGAECAAAGRSLADRSEELLAAFAAIFQAGGFPVPTPS